jgi:hypothetical protein
VSWWQTPEQQSHVSLQDIWFNLHTSPLGLQPIGRRQTPTVAPGAMLHVTGLFDPPAIPFEPQQSPSLVQRSPTGWQPLAGWQTRIPVGPQGAQARLQQPPPHRGRPPSRNVAPPHSMPSSIPQFAGPPGPDAVHVPSVCPVATWQTPVQQSVPVAHDSPGCPQKDAA